MQQYIIIILISTNLILIIKYLMLKKKKSHHHNYYLNIFKKNCLLILNFLDSFIFNFILVPKTFKSP